MVLPVEKHKYVLETAARNEEQYIEIPLNLRSPRALASDVGNCQ
jgi:hypothetical protein